MMKIPIGMIFKQIIDEKKLKAKDVANHMGVSRQAVYQSYAKQDVSDGEMTRWASALGVSRSEIMDRHESATGNRLDESNESSTYLMEHLAALEDQFKRLAEQLQNQLAVKDRQIEKLMDLLGKLDPVSDMSKVKSLSKPLPKGMVQALFNDLKAVC